MITVESRQLDPPREIEIGSRYRELRTNDRNKEKIRCLLCISIHKAYIFLITEKSSEIKWNNISKLSIRT